MPLLDVLGCPRCHAPLRGWRGGLVCTACGREYRTEKGIPVLLPGGPPPGLAHERELVLQEGHCESVLAMLSSLASDQVVLDIGAGNRRLDDPRVIRMDVTWTPFVEVVGDALALPFRDESVDVVLATAVWEHLRDPFAAAREAWRVLKPGGQIGIDCNFVFPFHGYPAVYFNASAEGLRQVFSAFTEVAVEVAPWQMPSYAVDALLREYARLFRPVEPIEHEFLAALQALERFPLREFDRRFPAADAHRIAAGVTFLGLKQPNGGETTVPPPVMALWARDSALQSRFPQPAALLRSVRTDENDTLLAWARGEGTSHHGEIARWFAERVPFVR